ncbi:unnamed protein product [Sphagnum troendelagicum]|uniref:Methionyl-tRNA formyltransferase, mitochondrial n=1 Tax=Sphagnum troendelagicum TaxID=128251 RepID=A0ABP0UHL1_9BRYO
MAPLWPLRLLSSSSRVCLPSSFLLHRACSLRPRVGRDVLLRCFCTADQQKKQKKKLVFLGTPEVAADMLDALLDAAQAESASFEIGAVVTQPPSVKGRGRKHIMPSAVAERALARNFPASLIWSPDKASEEGFLADLKSLGPDLCVTAAYGNYLPSRFLAIPPCGTVNVHPSLLPLYRGAAPVQRALLDGVKETGVSVAYTVQAMDSGPIIASGHMDVDPDIKVGKVVNFSTGTELLLHELPSILDGSAADKAIEQDSSLASMAPKVTVEEALLSFKEPALMLHNKVRAFSEWPGAKGRFYLQASDGKSKVIDLKIVTTRVKPPAAIREADGVVQLIDNALVVPCGERSALHILELQPPGKKIMGARDFCNGLRGHQILIEDTVESLTH